MATQVISAAAFEYNDDTSDPDLSNFDLIISGRAGFDARPGYKALQARGIQIAQYVNVVDIGWRGGTFDNLFEPADAPRLSISEWPGFYVVDLSSKVYRDRLVEAMRRCLGTYPGLHYFLDVFGERFYSNWNSMSASQKDTFAKGMDELGHRFGDVRDQEHPEIYLWANGTWANGHPALVPVVEHHGTNEIPFWTGYLDPSKWDPKAPTGQALIIAQGISDGTVWSRVRGVGPVACQGTYGDAPSVQIPGHKPVPARGGNPTPPPVDPPPVEPPVIVPPTPVPDVPLGVLAVPGPVEGTLIVSFDAPPSNVVDSQVYDGYVLLKDGITGRSVTLTGLDPSKEYLIRVSHRSGSVAGKGYGDWAPVDGIKVTPRGAPVTPPTTDPTTDELKFQIEELKSQVKDLQSDAAIVGGLLTSILKNSRSTKGNLSARLASDVIWATQALQAMGLPVPPPKN
jgi:hypothetical protein